MSLSGASMPTGPFYGAHLDFLTAPYRGGYDLSLLCPARSNPLGTLVDLVCETSETPHSRKKSCLVVMPARLDIFNALW